MVVKILAFGLLFDSVSKIEDTFNQEEGDSDEDDEEEQTVKHVVENLEKEEKKRESFLSKGSTRKLFVIQNENAKVNNYLTPGSLVNKTNSRKSIRSLNSSDKQKTTSQNRSSQATIPEKTNRTRMKSEKSKKEDEIPSNSWHRAYFREFSNYIDCFIVIVSLIYFCNCRIFNGEINGGTVMKSLTTIRTLRALRPLRILNNSTELKVVVSCLIDSIPAITNMFIIGSFVFFVYAVIGLNLFHGRLGHCSDSELLYSHDCWSANKTWTADQVNFDSITSSLLTVFELATACQWYNVMYETVQHSTKWAALYFVSFMLIGSLFVMNLSVTVIVDNFIRLNEIEDGYTMITDEQKEWVKSMRYFMKYKPIPSLNVEYFSCPRKFCYNTVNRKYFNNCINILIIMNVLIMCTRYDRDGNLMENFQNYSFYFFSFCFTVEILMKLIAYRKLYFIDVWNKFDFIVILISNCSVMMSIVEFYLQQKEKFNKYNIFPVTIRGVRILRVFRLINLNENVKDYFYTLLFLFPSLKNLGSLVVIILTIYAIIAMNLFGTIKHGTTINLNNNFQDFLSSMIFLIRTTTLDVWNDSMHELALPQPGCYNNQTYEDLMKNGPQGCGGWASYPFFVSFVMINSMIVTNLFIAVVVESFINNIQKSDSVKEEDMKSFFNIWGKYDKGINYYIEAHDFVLLMVELPAPLGIKDDRIFQKHLDSKRLRGNIYVSYDNRFFVDDVQCMKILTLLDIEAKNDKIHIIDAIKCVTKRAILYKLDEITDSESTQDYEQKMNLLNIGHARFNKKLNDKFTSYHSHYTNKKEEYKSNFLFASKVITKFIKKWRERKNASEKEKAGQVDINLNAE